MLAEEATYREDKFRYAWRKCITRLLGCMSSFRAALVAIRQALRSMLIWNLPPLSTASEVFRVVGRAIELAVMHTYPRAATPGQGARNDPVNFVETTTRVTESRQEGPPNHPPSVMDGWMVEPLC